jgi:hypothetical protein
MTTGETDEKKEFAVVENPGCGLGTDRAVIAETQESTSLWGRAAPGPRSRGHERNFLRLAHGMSVECLGRQRDLQQHNRFSAVSGMASKRRFSEVVGQWVEGV